MPGPHALCSGLWRCNGAAHAMAAAPPHASQHHGLLAYRLARGRRGRRRRRRPHPLSTLGIC
jgi:hypothetical protein